MSIELPEIETLRRDLEREVAGKKVKSAELASLAMTPRYKTRKAFASQLEGHKIVSVRRVGVVIVFDLDGGVVLALRFGPLTRLSRTVPKGDTSTPEFALVFTQGGQLRVTDSGDVKGELIISTTDDLTTDLPELADLGIDPIEEPMSWIRFGELLTAAKAELGTLLADPRWIIGIGPVYSDEILFHAGLRADRMSNSLTTQEIRRLYRALVETIHDAVKYRGTAGREGGFVDLAGKPGDYDEHLAVYGREGELSPRSRAPIRKSKYNGRWTYYCDTQM